MQERAQPTETHRDLIRERTRELIARAELLRQLEPERPAASPARAAPRREQAFPEPRAEPEGCR
jgi:hypothetical protein